MVYIVTDMALERYEMLDIIFRQILGSNLYLNSMFYNEKKANRPQLSTTDLAR